MAATYLEIMFLHERQQHGLQQASKTPEDSEREENQLYASQPTNQQYLGILTTLTITNNLLTTTQIATMAILDM